LWTGPISNAAVDVIQGAKSVEVRPIGVSKGAAIERIVSMMGERGSSSLIETEEVPMRDDEDGEGGGAKRTTASRGGAHGAFGAFGEPQGAAHRWSGGWWIS
jgi:hypothetical protein